MVVRDPVTSILKMATNLLHLFFKYINMCRTQGGAIFVRLLLTPWPRSQNLDQVFCHYLLFYICKSSSVSHYIVSIIVDNVNVIIIT